jgi:hypothetical protein
MSAPQNARTIAQRGAAEDAAVEGLLWLKTILELENHSNRELASSLTDSPLKVGCRRVAGPSSGRQTCAHACRHVAAGCAVRRRAAAAHRPIPCVSRSQPFWVAQAKCILFYTFSKTAFFAGRAKGHGFLLARCVGGGLPQPKSCAAQATLAAMTA